MMTQWSGFLKTIQTYWVNYGGSKALIASPYFHTSLVLLLITSSYWLHNSWWDQPLSILPNLLGFTLGGFAIFLSLGTDDFRKFISQSLPKYNSSPYIIVVSSFVHFVTVQTFAIIFAVIGNALNEIELLKNAICVKYIFSGLGYFLFIYSLTLALSVSFAIYEMAKLYENYQRIKKD